MAPGKREENPELEIRANAKRWRRAQESELDWWAHYRELPFYRNHSFAQHWSDQVSSLGILQSDYKGKNVIEVGCGPYGVVSYTFPEAHKIGIDPLISKYREREAPAGKTLLVGGVGESLPIRESVADLVLCINVIDHVMSARKVLHEIHRIMKRSARLVLEVHTFPAVFTPIMVFDRPHTYHWSRRRLIQLVQECSFTIDRIEEPRFSVPISCRSRFNPSHWKYIFGNWFMKLTYISATKVG
jgi:SAM-dependent methyltransferase